MCLPPKSKNADVMMCSGPNVIKLLNRKTGLQNLFAKQKMHWGTVAIIDISWNFEWFPFSAKQSFLPLVIFVLTGLIKLFTAKHILVITSAEKNAS